jgi:hypothetical protein
MRGPDPKLFDSLKRTADTSCSTAYLLVRNPG